MPSNNKTTDIMTIESIIKKIFKTNEIWYDYFIKNENECELSIEYGDWKHDHLFIDHLMRENGFEKTDEMLTWEDGSDCYSSVHFYKRIK